MHRFNAALFGGQRTGQPPPERLQPTSARPSEYLQSNLESVPSTRALEPQECEGYISGGLSISSTTRPTQIHCEFSPSGAQVEASNHAHERVDA